MIIRGCGAGCDNKGVRRGWGGTREQWPAVAGRPGEARCNLLRKIEGGRTIKEEGDARRDSEPDGSTMKLSTTKCRQLPIVRGEGGGYLPSGY